NLNGQEFPGIQQDGDRLCWPWGRAHKRIVNGPEDSIWHYYQLMIKPSGGAPEAGDDNPSAKPWWRFWGTRRLRTSRFSRRGGRFRVSQSTGLSQPPPLLSLCVRRLWLWTIRLPSEMRWTHSSRSQMTQGRL